VVTDNMIDMHTHILPGIDDGVKTEDGSVDFARMALEDGTRVIVATPHCKEEFYMNDRQDVLTAVERLKGRLAEEQIEIELIPGAEVHICPDMPARIKDGRAPTIADNGKVILLELSLSQYPVGLENLIFDLRLAGIEILFAHPERIRYFQDDIERYAEAVRLGAYGQITTGSVTGLFGREIAGFSVELLRKDLIHVLASDAHGVGGRRPGLSAALKEIVPLVGEQRAESMVIDVPRALIEGRSPDIAPPESPVKRQRSFFSRLFRQS
jgi:tyrosine-protein phosphatase YwqE